MDYGFSERRKNKNDKKSKARFNRFKKGGAHRSSNITLSNNPNNSKG
ncbi:MAG: hypothetical protein WCK90_05515 [archaeon]